MLAAMLGDMMKGWPIMPIEICLSHNVRYYYFHVIADIISSLYFSSFFLPFDVTFMINNLIINELDSEG